DPRVPRARQSPWPLIVIRTVRGVCVAAGILGFFLAFETDAPSAPLLRSLNVLFATAAIVLTVLPVLEVPWRRRDDATVSEQWLRAVVVAITLMGAFYLHHASRRNWFPLDGGLGSAPALQWWWRMTVLVWVCLGLLAVFRRVTYLGWSPATVLVLSFLTVILLGTGLLMSPYASASGRRTEFGVALFTATSATCVTGLVVVDTGTHWSRTGQTIILALIQVGGLGIMTYGAFFSLVAGRGLLVREAALLSQLLEQRMLYRVRTLVISILLTTLVCELAGAWLLAGLWPDLAWGDRLYYGLFHSISAFCNAGFGLQADSLEQHATAWQVALVVAPLIIVGGIGFVVLDNLTQLAMAAFRRHVARRPRPIDQPVVRLTLTSRFVLTTTAILLVAGMIGFLLLEHDGVLRERSWGERLVISWFQSVTCRTAGFNSVPVAPLREATLVLMVVLMFIGAAPGSTGGGIKTTTVSVTWFTLRAVMRNRRYVDAWTRSIPEVVVHRALLITSLATALVVCLTTMLLVTEHRPGRFLEYLFEVVSALGTVGLSTGVTPELTGVGRAIIILAMFLGRVGPLTLFISLASQRDASRYRYPEEPVMLG
ncbi:MAG: TrkH family potassium uptake protein, partial [Pirellulaceae bacterium]